jgi:hypothetical protein
MKAVNSAIGVISFAALLSGCSTVGHFKTPEGTSLYLDRNPTPVTLSSDGSVQIKPFFWNAAGGIKYVLKKDGAIVQQGKLPASFRIVSIFWPPYAYIYWPMGFSDYLYDLTTDTFSDNTK